VLCRWPPVVFTEAVTTTGSRLPRVRASELLGRGWLNTGGHDLSLADLRGKIVLLDFWTFCCVNCLHVLDELRELEEQYRDVLVIVGVHSPKFVHEADPVALAAAVERYEVRHPVLDDPELVTWSAYTARAWPTLVVIDPEGYVVAHLAGEGHAHNLSVLIADLIEEHEAKGTLHRGDGPYVPPPAAASTLRFPSKLIGLPGGTFLVADAGHHRLVELAADGETLLRAIGTGERGRADGGPGTAQLAEPAGLCLLPGEVAGRVGYDVVVADTMNHLLRGVRLADGEVCTVAGTGRQWMASDPKTGELAALEATLSSPWDVVWSTATSTVLVAMAGIHQVWELDPVAGRIGVVGGTTNEGLIDGPLTDAWFAQPSGLAVGPDGRVWVADSETSALRVIDLKARAGARIETVIGAGLFDFGHRDGDAAQALLQHPLGLTVLPDSSVVVADTYNGALRRYDPATGTVSTLARDLSEPSDVLLIDDGALGPAAAIGAQGRAEAAPTLLVVESAAHRLTRIPVPARLAGELVDGGAHRTRRPVTELAPGELRLEVLFTPASGQKVDERYGPSTWLQVSAGPPELLVTGAGDGTDLDRALTLAADVPEGVLHVTAHAASCDADPAIAFPACHLNQQDWGVPVRIAADGARTLRLPLLG
jgi:thiol-disulfide isomerase/thioredoxin